MSGMNGQVERKSEDKAASVPQPAAHLPAWSTKRATVGRVVHVYSDRWEGPRPGIVVFGGGGESYTVNAMLDGFRDQQALLEFRQVPTGNSLTGVVLYDPLTPVERAAALEVTAPSGKFQGRYIAEWPPVV